MQPNRRAGIARSLLLLALFALGLATPALAQGADPLPSWNEGPTKAAILAFVRATTTAGSPDFVPPADRIATFDQDGTLWVEKPVYAEVAFAADRVRALAQINPSLADEEPFKTAIGGDPAALAALSYPDMNKISFVTLDNLPVDTLRDDAAAWIATARNPLFGRLRTDLVYAPMTEVMALLRANGFRTYIVTGGGQDFVRSYAERLYGVPPEQVVGTADAIAFGYDAAGRPVLRLQPSVLFDDVFGGKPVGIHLVIGKRPYAAFGNSTGDRQMLEYTKAGKGLRFAALVLHDDGAREVAYGPAQGLPASDVGTFTQGLYDEAKARGWHVISMKSDWKRVFAFEP
ncbi:HAD family hydrolase [Xanthobacter sp. KR7-65]|uniref:HAD family hydrolase n=1 Tax=Xanthobacter sp. KR7-65 TaxID=3156612 RepID=UPI0032B59ED5